MIEQHKNLTKQITDTYVWGVSEYKLVQNFCFVDDKWVTREYEENGDIYYGEEVEPFRTKEEALDYLYAKILRGLEANDPCVERPAKYYGIQIPYEYTLHSERREAELLRQLIGVF